MNSDPKTTNQNPSFEQQFELLSVYIDQEATPAEKLQVEQWLATDPSFRQLYHQQLKLRQILINLPTPAPVNSRVAVDRFMATIEKRSRYRKIFIGGGLALAAAVVGIIGSVFTVNSPSARFAVNSIPVQDERLEIAIEIPVVAMSKSMTDD